MKEISVCKAVVGENVTRQHRIVVCRMTLMVKKMKRTKAAQKTKWWKLKKEECYMLFREESRLWVAMMYIVQMIGYLQVM